MGGFGLVFRVLVFRLFNYGLALVLLLLYDCRKFVVWVVITLV